MSNLLFRINLHYNWYLFFYVETSKLKDYCFFLSSSEGKTFWMSHSTMVVGFFNLETLKLILVFISNSFLFLFLILLLFLFLLLFQILWIISRQRLQMEIFLFFFCLKKGFIFASNESFKRNTNNWIDVCSFIFWLILLNTKWRWTKMSFLEVKG